MTSIIDEINKDSSDKDRVVDVFMGIGRVQKDGKELKVFMNIPKFDDYLHQMGDETREHLVSSLNKMAELVESRVVACLGREAYREQK